jgi:hypothetical protein
MWKARSSELISFAPWPAAAGPAPAEDAAGPGRAREEKEEAEEEGWSPCQSGSERIGAPRGV